MPNKNVNKNEYYPLSRLGKDIAVTYFRWDNNIMYELIDDGIVIVVITDFKYHIVDVKKGSDYKERNSKLYLSLRRFKGKIARENHFTYEE